MYNSEFMDVLLFCLGVFPQPSVDEVFFLICSSDNFHMFKSMFWEIKYLNLNLLWDFPFFIPFPSSFICRKKKRKKTRSRQRKKDSRKNDNDKEKRRKKMKNIFKSRNFIFFLVAFLLESVFSFFPFFSYFLVFFYKLPPQKDGVR